MARIFLIEIDPQFADCLRNIFETEGFEVGVAANIQDAIPSIEDFQPELTIIDMHEGEDVDLDQIKNLASANHGSNVLVTANYKTPEIACKALGAGATDYLLKPFSTTEIVDRVHTLTGSEIKPGTSVRVQQISDTIKFMASFDDVLKITLDQLVKSLNLADCLICCGSTREFKVIASRGYNPDPVGQSIILTQSEILKLNSGCNDPLSVSTGLVKNIAIQLGVKGHRPFPTIMPLAVPSDDSDRSPELTGFVMGHGALVVEETDILEMEQFLSRISTEMLHSDQITIRSNDTPGYVHEGEFLIPETHREDAVEGILKVIDPFLDTENDEFWIRLVLDEAINNAILHGHNEPFSHPVTNFSLKFYANPDEIKFVIEDSGMGFNFDEIPDPTSDENLMSINGRGIYLMKSIMDSVVFNEKGNMVTMTVKLGDRTMGPRTPDIFNDCDD